MIEVIAVIAGILLLSGFFSGAEAALVSLTIPEVDELIAHHKKSFGIHALQRVHNNINRAVITIVIFNNCVNIAGSIIVGQLVIRLYGNAVLAIITTALTFGIIIFSEILPKSLGIHYAERVSRYCSPVILFLMTICLPFIYVLEFFTNALRKGQRKMGTEAQIRSLVSIGRRAGHIENDEGQLIHRAFILNDKRATDVMTPLKDVISIPEDATIREAAEKVFQYPYSRYPVFGSSIHEVRGLLLSSDVLEALAQGKGDQSAIDLVREALVVKGYQRCDSLIVLFRDRHVHLAIVQENDHTVGLVTLEDVLEELVGEIEDETDQED